MPRLGPVLEFAREKIVKFVEVNEVDIQEGGANAEGVARYEKFKKFLDILDAAGSSSG